MINCITSSNDRSDTNYISFLLCKKSLHLVCLFDAKSLNLNFPIIIILRNTYRKLSHHHTSIIHALISLIILLVIHHSLLQFKITIQT